MNALGLPRRDVGESRGAIQEGDSWKVVKEN